MEAIVTIALSNKEVLDMYYKRSHPFVNLKEIKKLIGAGYGKASKVRDAILVEGRENKKTYPEGYVPFDKVLELANTNIVTIEKNYKKELELKL